MLPRVSQEMAVFLCFITQIPILIGGTFAADAVMDAGHREFGLFLGAVVFVFMIWFCWGWLFRKLING